MLEGTASRLDYHPVLLHETLVFSFRLQAVASIELARRGPAWNLAVPGLCSGAESSLGLSGVRRDVLGLNPGVVVTPDNHLAGKA